MATSFARPNSTWLFSVGLFESKVYSRRPLDLNALKWAISDKIINISEETLHAVTRSFSTLMHLYIQEGGAHLKDIVHKEWNNVKQIYAL